MIGKTMMVAAFALACTTPALAQSTMAGQSDANQTMSNGTMASGQSNGMMGNNGMKMSKRDMASMKRCKAMSSDMAAKNKKCTMLMQKYPDSNGSM